MHVAVVVLVLLAELRPVPGALAAIARDRLGLPFGLLAHGAIMPVKLQPPS